jgi:arylsulfatase A
MKKILSLIFILSAFGKVTVPVIYAAPPNIIVIYTDDQGYGDASNLNPDAKFKTPALDRLAEEGLTFTDGHCSDTVCTPSRYGLLTGGHI